MATLTAAFRLPRHHSHGGLSHSLCSDPIKEVRWVSLTAVRYLQCSGHVGGQLRDSHPREGSIAHVFFPKKRENENTFSFEKRGEVGV